MAINLLLSDVDGVMTDGSVAFDSSGAETKSFNIRDGLGVRLWQKAGGVFGIVTGRKSEIVARRAAELDIDVVRQGVSIKLPVVEQIASDFGVGLDQIAYVGDDLPDLPVIRAVGLGVAVGDAADEVKVGADVVLTTPGGRGAVRELVERILKADGRWETVLKAYTEPPARDDPHDAARRLSA